MEYAPTLEGPSFVIASRTLLEEDANFKINVPIILALDKVRIRDWALCLPNDNGTLG